MNNVLLILSLMTAAAYVLIGSVLPAPYLSVSVSAVLLAIGMVALWRYGIPAFNVVYRGDRGDEPGAHLAVYGMALLATGSVYTGGYGILWNLMGQPDLWVGSWFSAVGRATTAAGFLLMILAPEAARPRIKVPNAILLAFLMATAFTVVFLIGTQVR